MLELKTERNGETEKIHETTKRFKITLPLSFPPIQLTRAATLTAVIWKSWHHDPGSNPVLQWQRARDGRRLQVLRVDALRQLREAAVREGRVVGAQSRQGVHGTRVHAA